MSNTNTCEHAVGNIDRNISAADWNKQIAAFVARVDDFNVRGQRFQVNHPGFPTEFKFCPYCGESLDWKALGLQTYGEAFAEYDQQKGLYDS